ncbi:MAG: MFS transporter [Candidatus Gracilibacteria bacterium]|nr:MFS transporter [Candidatus Gracilibacteria bacterium]
MKNNIPRFYVYSAFVALSFSFVAIFMVFMKSRGLSYTEIGIITAWYYSLFLLIEIPTGMLADKIGRKNTLMMGMIFMIIGILTALNSYSFLGFFLSETIFSFARSFQSGTDSAFVYDHLAVMEQSDDYLHIEGKIQTVGFSAHVFGGLLGAMIAWYSLPAVYAFSALMALLGLMSTLHLKEPQIVDKQHMKLETFRRHFIDSLRVINGNPQLLWLLFYSSLIFILLRTGIISFIQPFLMFLEFPDYGFSFFDAVMVSGAALLSWHVLYFEKKLGSKGVFYVLPLAIIIGLAGMGLTMSIWGLLFYSLTMISWSFHAPVFRSYLNEHIHDSGKRATILSVEGFISRGLFALVSLALGWGLDNLGLSNSLLIMSGCSLLCMMILLYLKPKQC